MVKFPKSHWPPPESPDFVPPGYLPLFEAFNLVGQNLFPDEWLDGKELAAPSDEEIEANREASARRESRAAERPRRIEKAKRASRSVVSGSDLPQVRTARPKRSAAPYKGQPFPVDVIADEGVRKAARERGDKAWNRLRQWFYDGTVKTICLDDHGRENEITKNNWGRWNAKAMLFTGRATMNGRDSDVFVSKPHLEAAIRGDPKPDQAAAQDESTLGDEAIEPIPAPPAKTSETATPRRPTPPRGRPPKWKWGDFDREVTRIANTPDGLPENQADLVRTMSGWCLDTWRDEPADSLIRDHISEVYRHIAEHTKKS